jgi:ATP/maltotriose-dependent transcriptional regulator MalT
MTMSFLLRDATGELETSNLTESQRTVKSAARRKKSKMTILNRKLTIPEVSNIIERPRLIDLLERSAEQFVATLISGRAGTGKTVLASDFASRQNDAAWFSIDPGDAQWTEFSQYFCMAVAGKLPNRAKQSSDDHEPNRAGISEFLTRCFGKHRRGLVVLDNIHHLFDAKWFPEFFSQLIGSITPDTHILMLCRGRPQAPLWRLRSKQMLNVVDEGVLEFSTSEIRRLYRHRGLSEKRVGDAPRPSFGRASELVKYLDQLTVSG